MRANGRRVGRIVGQLDDLFTLAAVMRDEERERHPEDPEQSDSQLRLHLANLAYALNDAWLEATKAADRLNERDRPTGEPLAKR